MSDLHYTSLIEISASDVHKLKITDAYSLHRVVYSLFDDKRSDAEKSSSIGSGILFCEIAPSSSVRRVLVISDREPINDAPLSSMVTKAISPDLFGCECYRFDVVMNPTSRNSASKKLIPIKGAEAIKTWFIERTENNWGFACDVESVEARVLPVQKFVKDSMTVTNNAARITGVLRVVDKEKFQSSFYQGLGRGRAFGFGLLQIVPIKVS